MKIDSQQNSIETLYAEALALYHAGFFNDAEKKYLKILALQPNDASGWHDLGKVYFYLEQYPESLEHLYQALARDPSPAIYHYSLGLVWEKLGNFLPAIQAYQDAITLNPQFIEPYNHLGNVWTEMGELAKAALFYSQAITLNPHSLKSYFNLGSLFILQQQFDQAIHLYQAALKIYPYHPDILHQLAIAFATQNETSQAFLYFGYAAYYREDYPTAIGYWQDFLKIEKGDAALYKVLADAYQWLNQDDIALEIYQQSLQIYPQSTELYLSLMQALQNMGRIHEAIQIAHDALIIWPDDLSLQLGKQRLLPILYETPEEIHFYRHQFTQGLKAIIATLSLETPDHPYRKNALQALDRQTNFYLQYQGLNDLELQTQYGQFVHQIMAANFPQWVQPLKMPPLTSPEQNKPGKIKIGYLSACCQWHTVGTLFLGWLKKCNHQQFEVYCYYIGREVDERTHLFQLYSDHFHHIYHSLEAISQQILSDQLHILIFLEIGMYPLMTQLAGLRLASIQGAAWGHPVTSGSPMMDYFISGDLMEPENAQEHYSETLIRLPNLGIYYSQPPTCAAEKSRFEWGFDENSVIYLSCQSLFKYLPQYDYLFAAISQEVPRAKFVFLEHCSQGITAQFKGRIQRIFETVNLDYRDYCCLLPRQDYQDYLNLLTISDIVLDTLGFTGFMTTLEAIACYRPVVTCPGELMRSRQSAAILNRIHVPETIAANERDYIKIAIQLGLDSCWRQEVSQKIQQNQFLLYEDCAAIQALEDFYKRIVQLDTSHVGISRETR